MSSALVLSPLDAQTATRALVGTTIHATVTHIVDGDTIEVTNKSYKSLRVRLDGVDAPEFGKPFSRVATNFTRTLTFQQEADVRGTDVDRYGRLVARVLIGGRDVSLALVTAGLAWRYACYSNDPALADAERTAQAARRGLWIDPAAHPARTCGK